MGGWVSLVSEWGVGACVHMRARVWMEWGWESHMTLHDMGTQQVLEASGHSLTVPCPISFPSVSPPITARNINGDSGVGEPPICLCLNTTWPNLN